MYNLGREDCKALAINDTYSLHRAVYSLFPPEDGKTRDFLFADKGGDWNNRRILLLSDREPQKPAYGKIDSKEVPDTFLSFDYYGFEVILNPTKRDIRTGKIVPIKGKENLIQWFISKAPGYGFEVIQNSLQVNNVGVITYKKYKGICTHNTATFIGKLKVIDREIFIKSFKQGIGRAKGFGFGLLQIVPININN